jgi:hypothetical protein
MDILDQIMMSALEETRGPTGQLPAQPIAKLNYSHEAMVDLIIANPAISQNELARRFGYSAPWVSRVLASDAFQAKLAERSKEVVDPTVRQAVEEQFKGLVLRSLAILQEKLDRPTEQIPDQLALRAFEISSRAAGYGGKPEPPLAPPVAVHLHLENMADNLTRLLKRAKGDELRSGAVDALTSEG